MCLILQGYLLIVAKKMNHNLNVSGFSPEELNSYYNQRYSNGYMEEWSHIVKFKINKIFNELDISTTGKILDYGCGQGVLTALLKEILPTWNVCGTDISNKAIESARIKYPACNFFLLNELEKDTKFDLIFSHHVLEHVLDLEESLNEIATFCLPQGKQIHILPCGNSGSFEHYVSQLTKNGFERNGRFFFEEEGHLRRLESEDLEHLLDKHGFLKEDAWFANHYYGALSWITELSSDFINYFASPSQGISFRASVVLWFLRFKLLVIKQARTRILRANYSQFTGSLSSKLKAIIHYSLAFPWIPIVQFYERKALDEFISRGKDRRGSEMLLCFVRKSNITY